MPLNLWGPDSGLWTVRKGLWGEKQSARFDACWCVLCTVYNASSSTQSYQQASLQNKIRTTVYWEWVVDSYVGHVIVNVYDIWQYNLTRHGWLKDIFVGFWVWLIKWDILNVYYSEKKVGLSNYLNKIFYFESKTRKLKVSKWAWLLTSVSNTVHCPRKNFPAELAYATNLKCKIAAPCRTVQVANLSRSHSSGFRMTKKGNWC